MLGVNVLVVVMTGLCLGASLQEQEQEQEPLCPYQHSCTSDSFASGCSCEATCRIYGDCCRDSEHYDEAEQRRNMDKYTCAADYYMIGKCLHDWKDPEVEALCLKGSSVLNIRMALPVTNTNSSITYVNSYCAICNGEDPNLLRMWKVELYCRPYNPDISYGPSFKDGEWGIIALDSTDPVFEPCFTELIQPRDAYDSLRRCTPTINTCNDSLPWPQHLQSLCQSYSAAVYVGHQRFRNEHCAACNDIHDASCFKPVVPLAGVEFSLSMLFDVSDRSGNQYVGLTGRCGDDHMWDDHAQKCRMVICPKQGDKFKGGVCVSG